MQSQPHFLTYTHAPPSLSLAPSFSPSLPLSLSLHISLFPLCAPCNFNVKIEWFTTRARSSQWHSPYQLICSPVWPGKGIGGIYGCLCIHYRKQSAADHSSGYGTYHRHLRNVSIRSLGALNGIDTWDYLESLDSPYLGLFNLLPYTMDSSWHRSEMKHLCVSVCEKERDKSIVYT